MMNKIMDKKIFFSLKLSFMIYAFFKKETQNDCNIIHFIKISNNIYNQEPNISIHAYF